MTSRNSSLPGIGFMVLNTLALSILDICSKSLGQHLSSSMIVFFYKFTLLIITAPWIFSSGLKYIKTKKLHVHLIRSVFSVLGSLFFVSGLKSIPLADAAALENIQYILIAVVGVVFFKEEITKTKITSIFIALIGAMLIVKPEFFTSEIASNSTFNVGYVYIVLAISCWACNSISVKILGFTEHNKTQLFYLFFVSSIFSAVSCLIKWSPVEIMSTQVNVMPNFSMDVINAFHFQVYYLIPLAVMAAMYFAHGVFYFKALQHELTIVIPFRYTKLIFSGIMGYVFFNEMPKHSLSYLGYFLVTLSGLILIQYEIKRRRRQKKEREEFEALQKAARKTTRKKIKSE